MNNMATNELTKEVRDEIAFMTFIIPLAFEVRMRYLVYSSPFFFRNGGFVDVHTFGDLKMNNGRILPFISPRFCSIALLQNNLREFCVKKNGKHPF